MYDKLLTHAEIQGHVNTVNSKKILFLYVDNVFTVDLRFRSD